MSGCATGTPDWSNTTPANFNQTLLQDPSLCTSCTCPLTVGPYQLAWIDYYPNLAGNVLFAAIFAVFLVAQIFMGLWFHTMGFMISMICGLILEVIGYVGRILLRSQMFDFSWFLMYLIPLTIGPAFFSAGIYFTLSRIINIYGSEYARFKPQTYTYIFITFDVIALILQAAGGAVASIETPDSPGAYAGIHTMVAGLAWQVVSLAIFGGLCLDYWLRVMHRREPIHPAFENLRAKIVFQPWFMIALFFAALFIFIRCVFRCAELSGGFSGPLANNQLSFMILEGVMIILATGLLTFFHPGMIIGAKAWAVASFKGGNYSGIK